jgi:hypothetical protein
MKCFMHFQKQGHIQAGANSKVAVHLLPKKLFRMKGNSWDFGEFVV